MPRPDRDDAPAFPPWLRRIDRKLALEDSNAIYQAFRRRRLCHDIGRFATLRDSVMAITLTACLTLELVFVVSPDFVGDALRFLGVIPILLISAIFLPAGIYLIMATLIRRRGAHTRLPARCLAVLSGTDHLPRQLTDLWMITGAAGDYADALYLEMWDLWLRMWKVIALLFATGACVIAYFAAPESPLLKILTLIVLLTKGTIISYVLLMSGTFVAWAGTDARRSMLLKYINYRWYTLEMIVSTIAAFLVIVVAAGLAWIYRILNSSFLETLHRPDTADYPADLVVGALPGIAFLLMLSFIFKGLTILSRKAHAVTRRKIEFYLPRLIDLAGE